jgi:predicted  nucleic acid-binding Zn-ribbon protein
MKKSTLIAIAEIVNLIDNSNRGIYEMMELLNMTPEELNKVNDAIMVVAEKIERIKKSNISDLEEHIDVNYIENILNKY